MAVTTVIVPTGKGKARRIDHRANLHVAIAKATQAESKGLQNLARIHWKRASVAATILSRRAVSRNRLTDAETI